MTEPNPFSAQIEALSPENQHTVAILQSRLKPVKDLLNHHFKGDTHAALGFTLGNFEGGFIGFLLNSEMRVENNSEFSGFKIDIHGAESGAEVKTDHGIYTPPGQEDRAFKMRYRVSSVFRKVFPGGDS